MQEPNTPHATASAELLLQRARLGPAFAIEAGRVRLQVAIAFLVLAAVPGIGGGAHRMALSALLVLGTALVHELGHALCALSFGHRVTIVLFALGAHTTCEPNPARGRQIAIALAGPLFSLIVGAGALALGHLWALAWVRTFALASLGWGAINWLPFVPFDAGRALVVGVAERRRARLLLLSCAIACASAVTGLLVAKNALIFVLLGVAASASAIAWAQQRRVDDEAAFDLPTQLVRARRLLESGEVEQARRLATRIGVRARTKTTANAAWELVAWAELGLGLPERAYGSLGRVQPASEIDDYVLAAVTAALGRTRQAIGLLERSLQREPRAGAVKLLIDLHVRCGAYDRACEAARAWLHVLERKDAARVIEAARLAGASEAADRLARELSAHESPERSARVFTSF